MASSFGNGTVINEGDAFFWRWSTRLDNGSVQAQKPEDIHPILLLNAEKIDKHFYNPWHD